MTLIGGGRTQKESWFIFSQLTLVEPAMSDPMISFILRYRGIGIRIEDDVLITEKGPEVLTAECPKEIEDIERLMNNTKIARL